MTTDTKTLTPNFLWAQDRNNVYVKIDLIDVSEKDMKVDITNDSLSFTGSSRGKNYHLSFKFRFPINAKTAKYSVKRLVSFLLEKENPENWWPHLLAEDDKKRYKLVCKIDWEKFVDEDDSKKKGLDVGDESWQGLGGGMPQMPDEDMPSEPSDDEEEEEVDDDDDEHIEGVDEELGSKDEHESKDSSTKHEHDELYAGHPHDHSHDHPHDHSHGHAHDHDHDHSHTHPHPHPHPHPHDHSHESGHEHAHDHTHSHPHSHEHPHDPTHDHPHAHSTQEQSTQEQSTQEKSTQEKPTTEEPAKTKSEKTSNKQKEDEVEDVD